MLEKIYTDQAPAAIGPYSQAIKIENTLYTSGQIPVDPTKGKVISTEITEQAQQVMKNLQAVLEEGGSNLNSVIKTTCFLTDMADFAAFNEVYGSYFGDHKPARSCVAVKELPLNVRVEVEAIAVI
ncbi:RidA family protein [Carnobacterium maltaromaticum]|uniref:RidA family protein n=1 Tax=Carnobacterium maltaromaticum TaxID=2751 RepID=UPI00298AEAC0|nr:RidA family protein [Carnobacterium maltaromaticum]MDW5524287.1 RidA family protein [Carnobacterium maltaromaticum]